MSSTTCSPMSVQRRKVIGLFLGIAAGDRNGGPMRMLCRVAESIASKSSFDRQDIATRYYRWSFPPPPHSKLEEAEHQQKNFPAETEAAFDTGLVFSSVFNRIRQVLRKENNSNNIIITNEVVDAAASEYFSTNPSAGANPCHRNSVLAVADPKFIFPNLASLAQAARQESTITHIHLEAVETSIAVNIICRRIVEMSAVSESSGENLDRSTTRHQRQLTLAVKEVLPFVHDPLVRKVLIEFPYQKRNKNSNSSGSVEKKDDDHANDGDDELESYPTSFLDNGGRSPLVLQAALYFLYRADRFEDAMESSLAFAGSANYCPVLVGSIGGCLFGVSEKVLNAILRTSRESTTTTTSSWTGNFDLRLSIPPESMDKELECDPDDAGVTLRTLRHRMVHKNDFLTRLVLVALHFSQNYWQ